MSLRLPSLCTDLLGEFKIKRKTPLSLDTQVCTHAHTHLNTHTHTHTHTHRQNTHTHTHTHTQREHSHTLTHTHTHTHTHTRTENTHTYTRTHTGTENTHTHTQGQMCALQRWLSVNPVSVSSLTILIPFHVGVCVCDELHHKRALSQCASVCECA